MTELVDTDDPESVTVLILAAGSGSRFGGADKLLASLGGRVLIDHAIDTALAAGFPVGVVVGAEDSPLRRHVSERKHVQVIPAPEATEGIAGSLRAGVTHFAEAEAVVVLLGDQPLISEESVARVIDARASGVLAVRARYNGVADHPTLLERELFPSIVRLSGEVGASALLHQVSVRYVDCDDCSDPSDVDSVADLRRLVRAGAPEDNAGSERPGS